MWIYILSNCIENDIYMTNAKKVNKVEIGELLYRWHKIED